MMKINRLPKKVLTKLLREYGSWKFQDTKTKIQIVRHENVDYSASFDEVCRQAVDLIEVDHIQSLKFQFLVKAMKDRGLDGMYRMLMHQNIEEALLK